MPPFPEQEGSGPASSEEDTAIDAGRAHLLAASRASAASRALRAARQVRQVRHVRHVRHVRDSGSASRLSSGWRRL